MLALKTSKQIVKRFAFSADGRFLAAAGTGRKVHFWDLIAKKRKVQTLPTFAYEVEWIGFLPDGHLFALSMMGQYAVHNLDTGTTAKSALSRGSVGNVIANGTTLFGTDRYAQKWTFDGQLRQVWWQVVPSGGEYETAGRGGTVLAPDGTLITAVSNYVNRTWLHVRDSETGAFQGEHSAANSLIRDLTLFPDGRTLAFVREQEYQGPTPNAIVVGTVDGKFEPVLTVAKKGDKTFTSLALHPSGKWLAVGQLDGTVRTLDTTTWREVSAYQWPVENVEGLAFSPDGLKAAAGGADGKLVVWDVDLAI